MFKRILVPIDGSRYSSRAIAEAADMAKHFDASVYLLHVIRNMSLPEEIMAMIRAGEVTQSRTEILEDSAEIILENALEKLQEAGVPDAKRAYLVGDEASPRPEHRGNRLDNLLAPAAAHGRKWNPGNHYIRGR